MRLKRTRSRLAIGAMVALVASVTTAASASAQAGDDHYAVLVDPMTSDAPEDGGSIHVDTVDGFDAEGGVLVIDPGTDSEEMLTYESVDPTSQRNRRYIPTDSVAARGWCVGDYNVEVHPTIASAPISRFTSPPSWIFPIVALRLLSERQLVS